MKRVGKIGPKTVKEIAEKAALMYCEIQKPEHYVLTLSPEGRVCIERLADAAEVDIVGCYEPDSYRIPRWLGLGKQIAQDLDFEINTLRRGTFAVAVPAISGSLNAR